VRNSISTTFARRQGITQLSPEQSDLVECACQRHSDVFTYSIPITVTTRCVWCLATVARARHADGQETDLEIESGDQGELRALLTSPHRCPELESWEQLSAEADGLAQ
jgi:hypothetical protein